MSNSYDTTVPGGMQAGTVDSPGTLETAAHEASSLKQTTAEQAKGVLDTAKGEASSVLSEAKHQAKDLYAQTQRELKDQANTQQQRIAGGLRSVSDELDSMAANAQTDGLAGDLVRQVSSRLATASTWLGDRDPGALLQEVKSYARRKPGTFILGAAVAGVLVGRLTRALTANASEAASSDAASAPAPAARLDAGPPPSSVPAVSPAGSGIGETPIYAQSADAVGGTYSEDEHVRRDSF